METLRKLTLDLSKTAAIRGGKEEEVKLFCQAWAKNIDTERGYLDKVTKKTNLPKRDHYDIFSWQSRPNGGGGCMVYFKVPPIISFKLKFPQIDCHER